jgi:predicted nuclease of predicted toxin-antitoxin system
MISIYADENVEIAIVRQLRLRGVDVLTAEEDDHRATPDEIVLDRCNALGRVAFSRDEDFLKEATRRQDAGQDFNGVIFAHKANVTIGKCVEGIELLALSGDVHDFLNRVWYLPL